MPRIARGALGRGFFHVLNRGNHRQTLFHRAHEYAEFLQLLSASTERFKVQLWGYCLMSNHWHIVVEVDETDQLSQWMHWLCNRHVRQYHRDNPKLGGGHIYQGRFKSFPIEDEGYLYEVLRYVEANPLRARMVARAEDWPWSSLSSDPVKSGLIEVARPRLTSWDRREHWLRTVNQAMPRDRLYSLQQSVERGTPQGHSEWVAALATQHGMESTIRPRGRPRKPSAND